MTINKTTNKKAVSLMLSYVILVSIVIAASITTYIWLKEMAKTNKIIECEDGTYISISDYRCRNGVFNLSVKNNGRFNVYGILVFYSNDSNIAPSSFKLNALNRSLNLGSGYTLFKNPLLPGKTGEIEFDAAVQGLDYIKRIKIQPFILDKKVGRKVLCTAVVIDENLENCDV